MDENGNGQASADASVTRGASMGEWARATGFYDVECYGPDGKLRWQDKVNNVVCTEGKNLMLDIALASATGAGTGPFIGLVSSVSWSSAVAADTMASHAGWKEAGGSNAPTYTAPRKTASWSAASNGTKALSANGTYAITGTGTVKGCFMCYGPGAVSTIDSTAGSLWSAGTFSGGDKVVGSGDTLNVSYNTSL